MNRKLDKLEALLANKDYQNLKPTEKDWIDQQYTIEEYKTMRATMLRTTAFFQQEQTRPNPEIKSKLRQRLRQKRQPTKISPLLKYRIPAWQAVAAFALLLFFIPQMRKQVLNDPDKVFIYQTDTVFKEIPVEKLVNPIIDTVVSIPQVRKIINRAKRVPVKTSTVVFSQDQELGSQLSNDIADYFANNYDTTSLESIIGRYLKDSVKSYRVDVDTGFQDMGQIY